MAQKDARRAPGVLTLPLRPKEKKTILPWHTGRLPGKKTPSSYKYSSGHSLPPTMCQLRIANCPDTGLLFYAISSRPQQFFACLSRHLSMQVRRMHNCHQAVRLSRLGGLCTFSPLGSGTWNSPTNFGQPYAPKAHSAPWHPRNLLRSYSCAQASLSICCVVCGVIWCVVCGVWCAVCGMRCVVCGVGCVVWCVRCVWCVAQIWCMGHVAAAGRRRGRK